jgi:hypothetical protein
MYNNTAAIIKIIILTRLRLTHLLARWVSPSSSVSVYGVPVRLNSSGTKKLKVMTSTIIYVIKGTITYNRLSDLRLNIAVMMNKIRVMGWTDSQKGALFNL